MLDFKSVIKNFYFYFLKYLPYFVGIILISRTFLLSYYFNYLMIFLFIISIFIYFSKNIIDNYEFNIILTLTLFPVYSLFSSLWSLNPSYTFIRSNYLLVITLGILSIFLYHIRINFYLVNKVLLTSNLILVISSIFSLISGIPEDSWSGGNKMGFMGFGLHQNTLASALLVTIPGISFFYQGNNQILIKYNMIAFFLIFTNIMIIILTHSRATLLSLIFSIILFIFLLGDLKKIILLILILSVTIFLFSNSYKLRLAFKDYLYKNSSSLLENRIFLWKTSYEAALKGGIIGVGYGNSVIIINDGKNERYISKLGFFKREKGNGILALLEETGILGTLLFFLPIIVIIYHFVKLMKNIFDNNKLNVIKFYFAILIGSIIHSQFEAWWVGVNSVQYPFFLLLMVNLLIQLSILKKSTVKLNII